RFQRLVGRIGDRIPAAARPSNFARGFARVTALAETLGVFVREDPAAVCDRGDVVHVDGVGAVAVLADWITREATQAELAPGLAAVDRSLAGVAMLVACSVGVACALASTNSMIRTARLAAVVDPH